MPCLRGYSWIFVNRNWNWSLILHGKASAIQMALTDLEGMRTEKQWARLTVTPHMVAIYYGAIHSNGFEECAIGSLSYFPQPDGSVMKVPGRHCG